MYLTSFIHCEQLFEIAERWICGRPFPDDIKKLTEILICDGFVLGQILEGFTGIFLKTVYPGDYKEKRIHLKGELRDILTRSPNGTTPRMAALFELYRQNPDYYYREAPINAVLCLDEQDRLLGLYRIKRPKRIAEKANRKITDWIFQKVQSLAREMAVERARRSHIPMEWLLTPPGEMAREFIKAEEKIAERIKEGHLCFERSGMTIHDVGAVKVVADADKLKDLEQVLAGNSRIQIIDKEVFQGNYRATNIILQIRWDPEEVCRRYRDTRGWENFLGRGIPEERLTQGLEPFLEGARSNLMVELILSTFPDMVESELGKSIHEERMIAQRNNRVYKGYIPTNIEFLVEYLLAAGLSPKIKIEHIPMKLWGRYLPETLGSCVRHLYDLPEHDLF